MFAETPAIYIIPSSFWDFPYTRFWLGSKCTYLGKSFIFVVVILYVPMARNGVVFFFAAAPQDLYGIVYNVIGY